MSPQASPPAQPAAADPTTERLVCFSTRVHASLVRTDPTLSAVGYLGPWNVRACMVYIRFLPILYDAFTCT